MKTSIIIPTKNRWEKLQRTLKAIKKNTLVSHEVIIIFDGDEEGFKRLKGKTEYKIAYNIEPKEYWHCINQGCFLAQGDYIVYLADDIRPRKGWLKHTIEIFEKNFKDGIGIVALKTDLKEGITHAPHGLVSRVFVASRGYLAPDVYKHYFADTEISLRLQAINRYKCTDKVVLNHDKPQKNKKFADNIYSESWRNCWKNDEIQFHLRNPLLVAAMIIVRPDDLTKVFQTQLWAHNCGLVKK